MYLRLSDPVYAFLEDCCIEDFSSRISKRILYDAYCEYAKENKIKPLNIKKFGKCVQEQGCIAIEECWIGQDKGWQGVKFGCKIRQRRKENQEAEIMAKA